MRLHGGSPKPEFLDFREIVSPPKGHGFACIWPGGFPGQFPRVGQSDVCSEPQGRVHTRRLSKGGARPPNANAKQATND